MNFSRDLSYSCLMQLSISGHGQIKSRHALRPAKIASSGTEKKDRSPPRLTEPHRASRLPSQRGFKQAELIACPSQIDLEQSEASTLPVSKSGIHFFRHDKHFLRHILHSLVAADCESVWMPPQPLPLQVQIWNCLKCCPDAAFASRSQNAWILLACHIRAAKDANSRRGREAGDVCVVDGWLRALIPCPGAVLERWKGSE